MSYCEKCGAKLNEGDKFCVECGAPVPSVQSQSSRRQSFDDSDEDDEDYQPKKSVGKKIAGGILGFLIPVALVIVGVGIYGYLKGNTGDGGGNDRYLPNILPEKNAESQKLSGSSDEVGSKKLVAGRDIAPAEFNDEDIPDTPDMPVNMDELDELDGLDGIEGIIDLDEMSESDRKAYEERLFANSPERYEYEYTGTWQSVGLIVLKYRDIVDYTNGDLGKLIDKKMAKTNNIKFTFGNGIAKMWVNDKLNLEGKYNVRESGNISVDSNSGERTMLWMYSPDHNTLYSYVYYIEDDGTEKSSCIKYNRVN